MTIKSLIPPIVFDFYLKYRNETAQKKRAKRKKTQGLDDSKQDLDLYWDNEYAQVLEEWGKDSTWNEIQFILAGLEGKVLDIACGTGVTMKLLEKYKRLDLYGFDISDLLISMAIDKEIPESKLKVEDATKTSYLNNEFNYSYSIGSLEHFTMEGIDSFIQESSRYTKIASFHMVPVSKSQENEGWMKTVQSFFNNSENWWYEKFRQSYSEVYAVPSKWEDKISYGRWFLCFK